MLVKLGVVLTELLEVNILHSIGFDYSIQLKRCVLTETVEVNRHFSGIIFDKLIFKINQ